jgi:hypothetical protein
MSTKPIVAQTFNYDKSAKAWGRYDGEGELIHYHDTLPDAIRAALPPELAEWAAGQGDQKRGLAAAQLIANGEVRPDPEAYGMYGKSYRRVENGVTYAGEYFINVLDHTCTCPDFQIRQKPCKHLLAAGWLFAEYKRKLDTLCAETRRTERSAVSGPPSTVSLLDLARAAVAEHKHDDPWITLVIWQSNGRSAEIRQGVFGKPDDPLWLHLSGHAAALMVARLNYDLWPEARWHFIDDPAAYATWVAKIRNS